jgi:recombination protein RecA
MTPPASNDEVLKQFTKALPTLSKHFGDNVFIEDKALPVRRAKTGFEVIDHIFGGGIPFGTLIEIFGPESVGKTTIAIQFAAAIQRAIPDWRVLYLDYEHTVTVRRLRDLGMITSQPRLFFNQPTTIEAGTLLAKTMLQYGWVQMIIWDTPAASRPASEMSALSDTDLRKGFQDIEKGKNDTGQIGLHARVFSHAIGSIIGPIAECGGIAVFPNQVRTTINTYGAGETTPGGRALKFYSSLRVRLSKSETTKESVEDSFLGTKTATATENVIQFHVVKNKFAPPFRLAKVRLAYGKGFLDRETNVDLAIRRHLITKRAGGNFTINYDDGKSMRGTDALYEYIDANYDKLLEALRTAQPAEDEYSESIVIDPEEGAVPINQAISSGEESDTEDPFLEVEGLAEGKAPF